MNVHDFKSISDRVPETAERILDGLFLTIEEWAERQIKHNYELALHEFLACHPEWDKEGLHDIITSRIDQLKHSFGD